VYVFGLVGELLRHVEAAEGTVAQASGEQNSVAAGRIPKVESPGDTDAVARQERELCQFAEVNGWQVQGLREAIDDVAKRQRQDRTMVFGLKKAIGEVWRLIECVRKQLSEPGDAVEPRVGPLEQTAFGLAEAKDWVESDVAGLGPAMADGRVKVEEVRREVASLKAQPSKMVKTR
jgi:hypothetical protein